MGPDIHNSERDKTIVVLWGERIDATHKYNVKDIEFPTASENHTIIASEIAFEHSFPYSITKPILTEPHQQTKIWKLEWTTKSPIESTIRYCYY